MKPFVSSNRNIEKDRKRKFPRNTNDYTYKVCLISVFGVQMAIGNSPKCIILVICCSQSPGYASEWSLHMLC